MEYDDAVKYLQSLEKLGSIPGTETIRELLFRVHNPHNSLQVIHIAGTNGKGSVGAFLESILLSAGYKVGRYASPAVFDDLEIITYNRNTISKKEFSELVYKVKQANDAMEADGLHLATRFEVETAVAFLYFTQKHTDYALIECGMGGLLDATNVFEHPLLSVITNISYDHMSFLGNSLAEIAAHKAGIMKSGCMAIATHSNEESDTALQDYANYIGANFKWNNNALHYEYTDPNGLHCKDCDGNEFVLSLIGSYQLQNAALAICAVKMILPSLDYEIIKAGMKDARWPGRFEIIYSKPTIIIDGAHNPDGMEGLSDTLRKQYPSQKVICVIGVFADKDYTKELEILAPYVREYICIETPHHKRALSAKKLAEMIRMHYDVPVSDFTNISDALTYAKERTTAQDIILCCGSLSHLKFIKHIIQSWE